MSQQDPAQVAATSIGAMWQQDAASRMLGMRLGEHGEGHASVSMRVRADMVNGWEVCHGGLIAALADSAFAAACNSRGWVTLASGFDVSFLEPARLDDELVAEATERSVRGRSGVYDVTVRRLARGPGDEETVIALFRGRSRTTSRRNPALEP